MTNIEHLEEHIKELEKQVINMKKYIEKEKSKPTAQRVFNELLPYMLTKHSNQFEGIREVYKFKIGGNGGGVWTLDFESSPPLVTKGKATWPDCTIKMDHEDFQKLMENANVALHLFSSGKMKVDNPSAARKILKALIWSLVLFKEEAIKSTNEAAKIPIRIPNK